MHYPLFSDIVRTRTAALRIESGSGPYGDWRMVPVHSTNRLLASYEGTRGGKTGFTFKARHCFVGEVDRGGIPLIVAISIAPAEARCGRMPVICSITDFLDMAWPRRPCGWSRNRSWSDIYR